MKIFLICIMAIVALLILFFLFSAYPFRVLPYESHQKYKVDETVELSSTLTVLTWNMAFAYGKGSEGSGYKPETREFFMQKLDQMAKSIIGENADVVFLQEVDFDSSRSHHIDQLKYLGEKTGLKYSEAIASWENNYVPFPYWPLTHQFGGMKSGGGILSRYPIQASHHFFLAKPQAHPWWYNLFYLYRYWQHVDIKLGNKVWGMVNLHLEAFDQENREEQARRLVEYLKKNPHIKMIAGDFNTTPSFALKKSGFTASKEEYENDKTYEILHKSNLKEVISEEAYTQSEETFFTFPATNPDRRLDYIFYAPDLILLKAYVVKTVVTDLSDHLPLKAQFKVSEPHFIQD
jgi:endonuclease/exonuclease/phosphatase family metal-dependent hydrolase